ncbi:TonB-dependent receptor domain-containing protein [Silvibacterium acidisoli]|uniref:TonB-dependent receptor domain-containing protein n=1 Tax=Acidobacteriaceae bacterium ZG23-2 TaxID=2883246 RepID=UPI00406CE204
MENCERGQSGRFIAHILFILYLLWSCPVLLRAQSTYGSLTGAVTDSSGAAVAGASVTLINTATAEKQTQTTSEGGLYSFVNLNSGDYRLEIEKQGFKHVNRENVVIQVQQTTRLDVSLTVGRATETVTVTSEVPLLQSETSSLGQVVEERNANELPLNGRNVFSLVEVAPSVVMQGQAGATATGQNPFSWGNFQIGGAFANQSAEYLDGQPLNIGYINLPILIPTQDSIGEFKVQTNNIGPEWGKVAGGVLNLSTKSGSNTFHGEVYEYIRNKVLNANDWFSNNSGLARPPFTQNQFGGNIGGRVFTDRTFFFYSYEGFRLRQGLTFTSTVPTAAEQAGDLSALAAASGVPQLIDPCGGAPTCTTYTPVPFAGNVIPTSRISPTAKALLDLWPAPTNANILNNYVTNYGAGGNQNQNLFRADQKITDAQHLFVRFSQWNNLNLPADPLGTGLCVDRCTETMTSKSIAIGYNRVFTPNFIGNLDVSASRFNYLRTPKNSGFDFTKIGWPASFNAQIPSSLRTPPTPDVLGMSDNAMSTQGQSYIVDHDTQYWISPYVTLVRGRHTIQLGFQYEITLDNYAQSNIVSGSLGFNGSYTQDYDTGTNPNQNSLAFADFLLGWAQNPSNIGNHFFGDAVIPNLVAGKQNVYAVYGNDTYKITNKLTFNLGLRYEYQTPWTERFDRQSYFDPNAVNQLATAGSGSTVRGAIELVATKGGRGSRYNLNPNYEALAPRVGFAYSVDPNTVVRGGYGLFWIPLDANWATNPLNDPVNSIQTQYTGNNGNVRVPTNTIATPWPAFIQPPGRDPSFAQALEGQTISGVDIPQYNYGYMQQWNFDIQRTLPFGFFADIAYAANKGTHLPQYTQQVDQLDDKYLAQAAAQAAAGQTVTIAQQVPNPFASSSYPGSALSSPTINEGQLLRRFPQYNGVQYAGQGSFGSIYHSLQASLQKRFKGGGTLLAAYTWSKLLSNTDTITSWLETGGTGAIQDWNNLRAEKSLSSQDVPQHLIVSYVLDLPFGKDQRYLSGLPRVADKFVGGWGVDGVTSLLSGFPVNIGAATSNGVGTYGAGLRPNVVTGCRKANSGSADARVHDGLAGGDGWINSTCFTQPSAYTFGNEPRVDPTLRAQGIDNWDFAVFKHTKFGPGEKLGFEFRTEFFNLFNHVQFAPPAGSAGASSFGQITSQLNNPRLIQFAGKVVF